MSESAPCREVTIEDSYRTLLLCKSQAVSVIERLKMIHIVLDEDATGESVKCNAERELTNKAEKPMGLRIGLATLSKAVQADLEAIYKSVDQLEYKLHLSASERK